MQSNDSLTGVGMGSLDFTRHSSLVIRHSLLAFALLPLFAGMFGYPAGERVVVTATNLLKIPRASETIALRSQDIVKLLPVDDLKKIHVIDAGLGKELTCQTVDLNGDGAADELLFQTDFAAGESKRFELATGTRQIPLREQFRAYGRFVRERFDDFAWENDRIAHRMYGTALETWEKEPLTSSAVDVWCKRVRRLVVDDWYMVDNYHEDTGEGGDFYSAGKSRGCGGNGIWENGKLFVSRNFTGSKVIANGPIRVMFELTYAPWDVNGRKVSEVKRITLDAGHNFDRFESFYKTDSEGDITYAIGIKKNEGSVVLSDKKAGWLRTWEPIRKGKEGNLGCGIIADPSLVVDVTEGDGNYLVIAHTSSDRSAAYYAGFGWDRSGDFASAKDWENYVREFLQRLRSPIKVSLAPQ